MALKPGDGLYKVRYNPNKSPDKSKPWCVVNLQTGDINKRWFATKSQANDQLKAMYANMGDKAVYHG
jgi:hypothetical protein